jgi:hypothetical protein
MDIFATFICSGNANGIEFAVLVNWNRAEAVVFWQVTKNIQNGLVELAH